MATFKVGQRVRIIGASKYNLPYVGKEATIYGIGNGYEWADGCGDPREPGWLLDVDGVGKRHIRPAGLIAALTRDLAPLTDPRCDEFIADMERYAHLAKPRVTADVS